MAICSAVSIFGGGSTGFCQGWLMITSGGAGLGIALVSVGGVATRLSDMLLLQLFDAAEQGTDQRQRIDE
jgi:hypothetical protein